MTLGHFNKHRAQQAHPTDPFILLLRRLQNVGALPFCANAVSISAPFDRPSHAIASFYALADMKPRVKGVILNILSAYGVLKELYGAWKMLNILSSYAPCQWLNAKAPLPSPLSSPLHDRSYDEEEKRYYQDAEFFYKYLGF